MNEICKMLFENADEKYREFHSRLIPTVDKENIIGVRTPCLRSMAKKIIKEDYCSDFLNSLPHAYFEENQLHSFIICEIKDINECMERVNRFLPYVDNWATSDQLSPKCFKKNTDMLEGAICNWIKDDYPYTKRFALSMIMTYFLDDKFDKKYLDLAAKIRSDEYYVNMMTAWLFATALAKQYDEAIKYIENKKLDTWVHNKTIQKAVESYRITDKQKAYLRGLKILNKKQNK